MSDCFLDQLKIKNFRNIEEGILSFTSGINCVFGENGNGKTNLLEAIYVITERKSFRKNTGFPQLLDMNGEEPEISFQTKFHDRDKDHSYSGKLISEKNEYFLDGKSMRRKFHVHSVFINPFDALFFHTTSSFRRRWVDDHLSGISPKYKKNLSSYRRALKMRNQLLIKRPSFYKGQIEAIDLELSRYSVRLMEEREEFIKELEKIFTETFYELFSHRHEMRIKIQSQFFGFGEEEIFDAMRLALEKDLLFGKTRHGVHLDDYMLLLDGFNAFEISSLGQQKMAFLGLSFAYIELFKYNLGTYPIVLIDDVSGELDRKRWKNLIGYICPKKFQTFITTANEDFKMELERIEGIKRLYIHQGKVTVH
ncbi:MAG: DNA replication and repair protein RecF [Bacteriovoracales bacterium]|nr:DNA replication and repair protein RecF [Bacteriovoracales bacterium]